MAGGGEVVIAEHQIHCAVVHLLFGGGNFLEPVPSLFIGLIAGCLTGTLYGVMNPEQDQELEDPRLLLIQNPAHEPVQLIKIQRDVYATCQTIEDVQHLLAHALGKGQ